MKRKIRKEDIEWAKAVKEKFDNKCAVCGGEERINAHHLIPREMKEFKYDIDNGISLCPSHHRFSFRLSAHQNPMMFAIWFQDKYPEWFEKIKEKIRKIN